MSPIPFFNSTQRFFKIKTVIKESYLKTCHIPPFRWWWDPKLLQFVIRNRSPIMLKLLKPLGTKSSVMMAYYHKKTVYNFKMFAIQGSTKWSLSTSKP
jgi:hypothetical protein